MWVADLSGGDFVGSLACLGGKNILLTKTSYFDINLIALHEHTSTMMMTMMMIMMMMVMMMMVMMMMDDDDTGFRA